MDSEKKFSTEMMGFNKREVEEYIKQIKAEYETKLQVEKSDSNRLSNELTIIRKKLERYETDYIERQEKVANALITAEEQSKKIIDNARRDANEERERIEHLIELEKEKLLDIKKDVIDLKERTIKVIDKYNSEMNSLLD
ncbi:MAG: DivIVA domain-containing protein [Clostridia bacterium]